ncbi:hypothetical protein OE749_13380 [Aestuariibacter sp. AA17]|uniref:Uncharacterized protein n=1 Tax=Fluctibacter corallii TaxID=2984329 RepID=A0ABT3AAP1_9ALTE|nr:hypothetical protein [Aestuariibacter sp. AA17]MCV2885684.1 hypothetical protein [Aestuariibacter sp. AA17]
MASTKLISSVSPKQLHVNALSDTVPIIEISKKIANNALATRITGRKVGGAKSKIATHASVAIMPVAKRKLAAEGT